MLPERANREGNSQGLPVINNEHDMSESVPPIGCKAELATIQEIDVPGTTYGGPGTSAS